MTANIAVANNLLRWRRDSCHFFFSEPQGEIGCGFHEFYRTLRVSLCGLVNVLSRSSRYVEERIDQPKKRSSFNCFEGEIARSETISIHLEIERKKNQSRGKITRFKGAPRGFRNSLLGKGSSRMFSLLLLLLLLPFTFDPYGYYWL